MNAKQMTRLNKLTMHSLLSALRKDFIVLETIRCTTLVLGNNLHGDVAFCVNVATKGRVQIGISFDEMETLASFQQFKSYLTALEFLQNYVCMELDSLRFEFSK
jgi:hypothetical protein